MLAQLGRHARFDLRVQAKGDLEVDAHHTVEDTGIAIGQALAGALGDKAGVRRFGDAVVPLDEARARAAVDLSGRPFLVWDVAVEASAGELGGFDPRQARHLLEALVANARCTVHVVLEAGDLPHHCLEACFKALARALGDACAPDPRAGSGSTKGVLDRGGPGDPKGVPR
jgi:imidazoleglycerol-phosphate dehydratase